MLKIPIIKFQAKYIYIVFEKRYSSSNLIIPLGADCHPAYVLNKLNIRNQSFPFDWLYTSSIQGIRYVVDNLNNEFVFFISHLKINERGHIISDKYKFTEFLHEKDLIENEASKEKFKRRIDRFKKCILYERCDFLYNVFSSDCNSDENVFLFVNSVKDFIKLIKKEDRLCIYIRYDQSFIENEEFCNKLLFELKKINNVYVSKYIRDQAKFGIWGNENKYQCLLKDLKIKLTQKLPRIYINFKDQHAFTDFP